MYLDRNVKNMGSAVKYHSLTDVQLIILLNEGDHSAFSEIYRRYHQLMINFAYKKLTDVDLTEDFVQELFTNLWQKRTSISQNGNLASYLYISLRSSILNYFANQNVQTKYFDALRHTSKTVKNASTDHKARERLMNDYIELQIMALPKKMRIVFQMSRVEHLSHKQIAERLETSEENVAQHITRALRTLKSKLTVWIFM